MRITDLCKSKMKDARAQYLQATSRLQAALGEV